jgi:hypothetical protein
MNGDEAAYAADSLFGLAEVEAPEEALGLEDGAGGGVDGPVGAFVVAVVGVAGVGGGGPGAGGGVPGLEEEADAASVAVVGVLQALFGNACGHGGGVGFLGDHPVFSVPCDRPASVACQVAVVVVGGSFVLGREIEVAGLGFGDGAIVKATGGFGGFGFDGEPGGAVGGVGGGGPGEPVAEALGGGVVDGDGGIRGGGAEDEKAAGVGNLGVLLFSSSFQLSFQVHINSL